PTLEILAFGACGVKPIIMPDYHAATAPSKRDVAFTRLELAAKRRAAPAQPPRDFRKCPPNRIACGSMSACAQLNPPRPHAISMHAMRLLRGRAPGAWCKDHRSFCPPCPHEQNAPPPI